MSLINVSLNLTAYADEPKTVNPLVKFADYSWSMLGMPTGLPKQVNIKLSPGESKQIVSTARSLTFNNLTSFDITQDADGITTKLVGDFGARTARADGDGTTQWAITVSNKLVTMTFTGTGTAPTFGGMVAGDGITLGTGFNALNQGSFTIVKVGANYVQFVNALGQTETVAAQAQIYSSGPVQVGDILDLQSSQFVFPNRGQFEITEVTDSYVKFKNANAVPESGITGVTSGLVIYTESYKWMLMAFDRKVQIQFNNDASTGCEVEPPVEEDLAQNPGLLLKRGKVFELTLTNPGQDVASGIVMLAE